MFNEVLRSFFSSLIHSFVQLTQRQGPGQDSPSSLSWVVFIISNDPCCRRIGSAAAGLQSRTCTAASRASLKNSFARHFFNISAAKFKQRSRGWICIRDSLDQSLTSSSALTHFPSPSFFLPLLFSHKNKISGWPPPGPGSWGGLQGPPYSWDSMNSSRERRDCLTKYVATSPLMRTKQRVILAS